MNAPEFEKFWRAWPSNLGRYCRKGGKAQCLKVWNKNYNFTQIETILRHVEWLKTTSDWLKDQGAFIPAPLVYLNQQRWDGADIPGQAEQTAIPPAQWLQEHDRHMAAPTDQSKAKAAIERMAAIKQKLRGTR